MLANILVRDPVGKSERPKLVTPCKGLQRGIFSTHSLHMERFPPGV